MSRMVGRCIFCGSPDLTNEHVFSKWTHKYLGPRGRGRASRLTSYQGIDEALRWTGRMRGQVRDWQVRCVCGGDNSTCNNGWMKQIEDRSKPILKKLITGVGTRISPKEQSDIVLWACLKTLIAEFDPLSHRTIPFSTRMYLKKNLAPPIRGWGVWIGHYERKNWTGEWNATPFRTSKHGTPGDGTATYNSKVSTQVLGKLYIQVMHSPYHRFVERWRHSLPEGGPLIRIWPPTGVSIKWPLGTMTDLDADTACWRVQKFLIDSVARSRATPPT